MKKPCVAMQTDFGVVSGAMIGVCKTIDPELEIFDISHNIPKFNVEKASSHLRGVLPFWPKGTVFVSVVDPGVGTPRRASVAKTSNGYYIVTPDNGSLTGVLQEFGIDEIREIDETVNRLKVPKKQASSTAVTFLRTARENSPRVSSTSKASAPPIQSPKSSRSRSRRSPSEKTKRTDVYAS